MEGGLRVSSVRVGYDFSGPSESCFGDEESNEGRR